MYIFRSFSVTSLSSTLCRKKTAFYKSIIYICIYRPPKPAPRHSAPSLTNRGSALWVCVGLPCAAHIGSGYFNRLGGGSNVTM